MGCIVRGAPEKAERFPGCAAEVTWPYTCTLYPSFQELAKRLQDSTQTPNSATVIGGKIMSKTTCVGISFQVCLNP